MRFACFNMNSSSFCLSSIPEVGQAPVTIAKTYHAPWNLYVVTGVLFEGDFKMIGNGVHVPTHFWKVVCDAVNQDAIAFLVPHRDISKGDLPGFIVSVDEVERRTGLDFNRLLDDAIENDIEDDVERMW